VVWHRADPGNQHVRDHEIGANRGDTCVMIMALHARLAGRASWLLPGDNGAADPGKRAGMMA
jgi:hypothetical protein